MRAGIVKNCCYTMILVVRLPYSTAALLSFGARLGVSGLPSCP